MPDKNEARWLALWQRLGARGDGKEPYADLVRRYSERRRKYHTLSHIEHCLDELEEVRDVLLFPSAAELALWYHDAVCRTGPGVTDNEEKSAELMRAVLREAFQPGEAILGAYATRMILATKHDGVPGGSDARLIVDIDLASLGFPQDEFYRNWDLIREEYWWVPEKIFLTKRLEILDGFLKRPAIYYTEFFREKYEAQARSNIEHAIARFS